MGGQEIIIPRYSGNEYRTLRKLFEDEGMPAHFDEWEEAAKAQERNMPRLGSPVRRVEFKMNDFLAWTEANGRGVKHDDRDAYIRFLAGRK